MKTTTGDYVMVLDPTNKYLLCQVQSLNDDKTYTVIVDDENRAQEDTTLAFDTTRKSILANFGPKPPVGHGKVFGKDIKIFSQSIIVRPWGHVHIFRDMTESELQKFTKRMKICGNRLQGEGLFIDKEVVTYVEPPHSKWAGEWRHVNKEEKADVLKMYPATWENMDYLIYHEAGHGVWYNLMTPEMRADWVSLYSRLVAISQATDQDMQNFYDQLIESGTVKAAMDALDHEQHPLFKEILSRMKKVHNISVRGLNDLLEADRQKRIKKLWPTTNVEIGLKEECVSEYAMTKVEELFAEAFGFYMSGLELPESAGTLLTKTLKAVQKSRIG